MIIKSSNKLPMTKCKQKRIESEVKESLKANERYRWYKGIQRLRKNGMTTKNACKELRIGRSEYYYLDRRVKEKIKLMAPGNHISTEFFKGLSKKPHSSPSQITDIIENLIIKIRNKTNQGSEYIHFELLKKYTINLSITGIYKVLKRNNLIKERIYHRKKKTFVVKRNYQPGEKVQIDTKHLKDAHGRKYYQFGAIDVATGIIFKQIYENIDGMSSCEFLRNCSRYFPFKIRNVQTDNGFEYTWRLTPEIEKTHPFTIQCQLMQIRHLLIPPASPTYNSHIERTHRIDMEELWRKRKFFSLKSMKKELKKHVYKYNHLRATPSKNWRTPIQYANDEFGLNLTKLNSRVQDV